MFIANAFDIHHQLAGVADEIVRPIVFAVTRQDFIEQMVLTRAHEFLPKSKHPLESRQTKESRISNDAITIEL
jgi:hypothetical protein